MATKRFKSGSWEFCVRRAGVLPKPVYLRFKDLSEGEAYVARLEQLLAAGVVPPEFSKSPNTPSTINQALDVYLVQVSVPNSDERILITLSKKIGKTALSQCDYAWIERFVKSAKQVDRLAPSTIRHQVGALARMFDFLLRRGELTSNPCRLLPKGYASYTPGDGSVLAAIGKEAREDQSRDRRMSADEEAAIRRIFNFEKPAGKERAFALPERDKLLLLFDLALETAMRLRECYTLTMDQIDLPRRTIFLDKTKNGDNRQVPLSSVAVKALEPYRGDPLDGLLFPWWDGDPSDTSLRRTTSLLSRAFARIADAAGCGDLRFHDLRHEATSRLFEKTTLSEFEIAKITGHRSPRMLMRYANLRGSNLAAKLW